MNNSVSRIEWFDLESNKLHSFFSEVEFISSNDINFIPYKRYILTSALIKVFGMTVIKQIVDVIQNYSKGCVIVNFGKNLTEAEYIKVSTALSHFINKPLPSDSSGRYFGITSIKHCDNADFKLLEPYESFTLHTDGVFLDNPVDWLLMLKIAESNALGGFSRLLHIDDWEDWNIFYNDSSNIKYRHGLLEKDSRFDVFNKLIDISPAKSKILSKIHSLKNIKFVDQYVIPDDYIHAEFISKLQKSLETSPAIFELPLPVGSAIILNNNFWMHGRSAFQRNERLLRVMLRQYGYFKDHHNYYDAVHKN